MCKEPISCCCWDSLFFFSLAAETTSVIFQLCFMFGLTELLEELQLCSHYRESTIILL